MPASRATDATGVSYPERYLVGITLFNQGQFWHAHEAWEDEWKAASDPQVRRFYQGIIQTAAALVHWQRGNPRGLHLNWNKARPKLASLPATMFGLDVQVLIAAMDHFVSRDGQDLQPPTLTLNES